jgi:predicted membrane channel-forming protein YqfA (hemolysin III family)
MRIPDMAKRDQTTGEEIANTVTHVIGSHLGAAMLALLKIARIASGHAKADNWVDLAGYAACGGEIETEVLEK